MSSICGASIRVTTRDNQDDKILWRWISGAFGPRIRPQKVTIWTFLGSDSSVIEADGVCRRCSKRRSTRLMPGRHINDHQMRLYMKSRLTEKMPAAAAQAGDQLGDGIPDRAAIRGCPHRKRRRAADADPIRWSTFLMPRSCRCSQAAPGLRPIAIFEEMQRRHPQLPDCVRRTLERRIRAVAGAARARSGCDLPPGARAWSHGAVGLYRDGRAEVRHLGSRARSSAVPLPAGLLGL